MMQQATKTENGASRSAFRPLRNRFGARSFAVPETEQQSQAGLCGPLCSVNLTGLPLQAKPEPNRTGMPDRLKAGVESLSGMDLSGIRVHVNSDKPAQLNALAYAQGNDIHLTPGQERYLPHEAWHVVQQKLGRVRPTLHAKGVGINDDPELEREADRMGTKVAEGTPDVSSALYVTPEARISKNKANMSEPAMEERTGSREQKSQGIIGKAKRKPTRTDPSKMNSLMQSIASTSLPPAKNVAGGHKIMASCRDNPISISDMPVCNSFGTDIIQAMWIMKAGKPVEVPDDHTLEGDEYPLDDAPSAAPSAAPIPFPPFPILFPPVPDDYTPKDDEYEDAAPSAAPIPFPPAPIPSPPLIRFSSSRKRARKMEEKSAAKATRRFFDPTRVPKPEMERIQKELVDPIATTMDDTEESATVDITGRSAREIVIGERAAIFQAAGPEPKLTKTHYGEIPRPKKGERGGAFYEQMGKHLVHRSLNPGQNEICNLFVTSGGSYDPRKKTHMGKRMRDYVRAEEKEPKMSEGEAEKKGATQMTEHLRSGDPFPQKAATEQQAKNATKTAAVFRAEVLRGAVNPEGKNYSADVADLLSVASSSDGPIGVYSAESDFSTFQLPGASKAPPEQEQNRKRLREMATEASRKKRKIEPPAEGQVPYRTPEAFHQGYLATYGGAPLSPGSPYSEVEEESSEAEGESPEGEEESSEGEEESSEGEEESSEAEGGSSEAEGESSEGEEESSEGEEESEDKDKMAD